MLMAPVESPIGMAVNGRIGKRYIFFLLHALLILSKLNQERKEIWFDFTESLTIARYTNAMLANPG